MLPTTFKMLTRWHLLFGVILLLGIWLAFFDSHSLLKRYRWHQERELLHHENQALRKRIDVLESKLEKGLSKEDVERIAREQYGMRRPGETVYRVAPAP